MGYRLHHNMELPRLPEGSPQLACKFCMCEDLRLGGYQLSGTYLACPKCGADGPIAKGPMSAIAAYQGEIQLVTPARKRGR